MALGGRKSIDPDAVIFGLQQIANSGTDSAQRRFPIRQRVKGARTVDSIVVPSAVNSNYQNAAGRVAEGGQCFCKRNPTVLGQLPLSIEDGTLFADCGCLEIEGQTFLRLELDSLLQECLLARNDIVELHPIPRGKNASNPRESPDVVERGEQEARNLRLHHHQEEEAK